MGYIRTSLFSLGAVVAYCLIANSFNCQALESDLSKIILITILAFLWCVVADLNKKIFW